MRPFVLRLSLFVLISFAGPPAFAGPDECKEAVDKYNTAISEIEGYLRRYTNCVAGSQGRDDCSFEFRRLKSSQDDFETAVSEYSSECG